MAGSQWLPRMAWPGSSTCTVAVSAEGGVARAGEGELSVVALGNAALRSGDGYDYVVVSCCSYCDIRSSRVALYVRRMSLDHRPNPAVVGSVGVSLGRNVQCRLGLIGFEVDSVLPLGWVAAKANLAKRLMGLHPDLRCL